MVLYVFLDPLVVSDARAAGQLGLQAFVGILRALVSNCCLAEFEDYRLQTALKEEVDALPESFDRTEIKKLLAHLAKRNRFIYCLVPDYVAGTNEYESACAQAVSALLDLLLIGAARDASRAPAGVSTATLATYQTSAFETRRSELAIRGCITSNGEFEERVFLEANLRRALRFATRIEICDRLFGPKFGDNYEYTARKLMRWLASELVAPDTCKIVFHCENPPGHMLHHIQTQLAGFRRNPLTGPIEIHRYEIPTGGSALVHARFIWTDQFAFGIDRGMDFLDRASRRNRDVHLTYADVADVESLLAKYSAGRLPIVTF